MAWELTQEMQQATRARLTGAEYKVLAVIAQECRNLETRMVTIDRQKLARLAHLSEDGVKRALRSLRNKKLPDGTSLDPRVAIPGLYGPDGVTPVYAYPGRPVTYRMPVLVDEPDTKPDDPDKGAGKRPPKGGGKRPGRGGAKGGTDRPPSRAEIGRARAAAVAACPYCDHVGHLLDPVTGRTTTPIVQHHPRPDGET